MTTLPTKYIPSTLSTGQTEQYNHEECGDTKKRLYVTKTVFGYLFHCHNCAPKMSGIHRSSEAPTPQQTLQLYEELIKKQDKKQGVCSLPSDFTKELPEDAYWWLAQYDITKDDMQQYGMGYSRHYDRLILPVYDENQTLLAWQGRYLGCDKKPKYITRKRPGSRVLFSSKHGVGSVFTYNNEDTVCIVEDIASAVVVGKWCPTIALLGSDVPHQMMSDLLGKRVVIWLDMDKWKEAKAIQKRMIGLGIQARAQYTPYDPKESSTYTISCAISP